MEVNQSARDHFRLGKSVLGLIGGIVMFALAAHISSASAGGSPSMMMGMSILSAFIAAAFVGLAYRDPFVGVCAGSVAVILAASSAAIGDPRYLSGPSLFVPKELFYGAGYSSTVWAISGTVLTVGLIRVLRRVRTPNES